MNQATNRSRRVLVSLVTFNAGGLTVKCLESLEPEMRRLPAGSRVIVVDNRSTDGSTEQVRNAIAQNGWEAWTEFIVAPGNDGYAAGNNVAMRRDRETGDPADYVILLNPDTVVRPNAFTTLLNFMERHPEVGIAGSRSENPDGSPQLCCFRFPNWINEFSNALALGVVDRLLHRHLTRVPISDEAHEIDWVSGASMIIRREVLDDVGLMDEGYFLYFEETDLTLRARRAGWTCWYVPQSRIIHYVGYSTGVTKSAGRPKRRPAYWFESRRRYFARNYGLLYTAWTDALTIIGLMLFKLRMFLLRRADDLPPYFVRDMIAHSVFVKGVPGEAPPRTEARRVPTA